jgi:hypothetical protein
MEIRIEDLPWAQPGEVASEEHANLAKKLSHGKPLS